MTSSVNVTLAVGYTAHLIGTLLTVEIALLLEQNLLISIVEMHELSSPSALKVQFVLEELVAYFP